MKKVCKLLLSVVLTLTLLLTAAACASQSAEETSTTTTAAAPAETTTAAPEPTVIEYINKMTLTSDAATYVFYLNYDAATRTLTLTSDNTSDNAPMYNLGTSFLLNASELKALDNGVIPDTNGAAVPYNILTNPLVQAGLVDHVNICAGNPYSRDNPSQEYTVTRDASGKVTALNYEVFQGGASQGTGTETMTYDANGKLTKLDETASVAEMGSGSSTLVWTDNKLTENNYSGGGYDMNTRYEWNEANQLTKFSRTMSHEGQTISYDTFYTCDPATGFITQISFPDSQATVNFTYNEPKTHVTQADLSSESHVTIAYEYGTYTVPA